VGVAGHVAHVSSQASLPEGQLPHDPSLHNPLEQTTPHPPQLPLSLPITLTHVPLQFVSPEGHAPVHAPFAHCVIPLTSSPVHATQALPQTISPIGQLPHTFPVQFSPSAQAFPQLPQFWALVDRSKQASDA
jgi:hypothetical protein